ncbi:MAG: hypothetical protein ACTHQ3_12810 [Motilibacteraceae bacterium]
MTTNNERYIGIKEPDEHGRIYAWLLPPGVAVAADGSPIRLVRTRKEVDALVGEWGTDDVRFDGLVDLKDEDE